MKAVIQRVTRASVEVAGEVVGAIDAGLLVLLGVAGGDSDDDIASLARKIPGLRIFDDPQGRMNLSLIDTGGAVLVVSQFTLCADTTKGRRPAYTSAMRPEMAAPMVDIFVEALAAQNLTVARGVFGAHMSVSLVNDGPVTIVLDTRER